MVRKFLLPVVIAASFISPELCGSTATKKKSQVKNNSGVTPAGQCGTWIKESNGGYFTSPNYPERYPPERECVYIIEAAPRECVDLFFDDKYSIEPSWECKFDHIEVRDGPFAFSPIIGRYCGQEIPTYVRSSGRYLYIKFVADGELEATGFSARYNFTQDPEFTELGSLPSLPFCEFEMNGPEGFVESLQITRENRALQTEAVDCRWYIKAPPKARIYMRFLEYEMHNSNECKRNFVAIYDGSSSVEHLKNKFCSTVANDVMLDSSFGVIRLWADERSRKSKFRILFTIFHAPPCDDGTFFCHSNMCINHTLVCNGIQNCVYPWDENHCKEKRQPSILDSLDNTNLTIIGVTCGLVVILLVISVIIQVKQPRKKYIIRRDDFDPALMHPGFEPPHYELCTLRRDPSGDLADGALVEDFQKLRRTSSRCIRDHHCGSQQGSMHGSVHGSRSNLSMRDDTIDGGLGPLPLPPPMVSQQSPLLSHHTTPTGRRNILVMKHSYSQDAFVPATTAQVSNVLSALRARTGTLVDIGSGDGRIVIAAAKQGFRASGFELNPWLVWYSRYKAWKHGVHHTTSFHISDLWKVSFAQYPNVVIFGVPQMMERLENKLSKELPSTAKVVACRFPFPTWIPEQTVGEGIDTVWVYNAKTFKCHERTVSAQSQHEH